jgi:hypothetical protein
MFFNQHGYVNVVLALGIMCIARTASADTDISKYPLGMSPKTLHDTLVSDKFVFESFTEKKIVALKRVAVNASNGSEFTDIIESTKITASICSGKLFRLKMTTVYGGNREALLLGRKSFYKYLKDNNAVNEKIDVHKVQNNPGVVLAYTIDRNNQARKDVRGTEVAKVSLGISAKITNLKKEPLLKMTYYLTNKWFCPN